MKRAKGFTSILLCISILCSIFVVPSYAASEKLVSENSKYRFYASGQTFKLEDKALGTTDCIIFSNDYTKFTIYNADGTMNVGFKDSQNNIWIDGILSSQYIPESSPNTAGIIPFAVPAGYNLLSTGYGTLTQVVSTASLVAMVIAYIPTVGQSGNIFNICTMVITAIGVGGDVYIKFQQYLNKSILKAYDVVRFYKKSNYTGLITTLEHGPYKYGR